MITINLLPKEIQKERKLNTLKSLIITVVGSLLAFFLVVWILLGLNLRVRKARLNSLNKRWESLVPVVNEVVKLEEYKKTLEKRVRLVDDLLHRRMLWAKKLNDISRLIPDGVWLRSLRIGQKSLTGPADEVISNKALIMDSICVSLKGEEMLDLVGRFMANLKDDKGFFQDFVDIRLGTCQREQRGSLETMNFELTLWFTL